jgi:hypothetical protein
MSTLKSFSSPILVKFIQKAVKVANLSIQKIKSQVESEMAVQLNELQCGMAIAINDKECLE